jgi:putative transposase
LDFYVLSNLAEVRQITEQWVEEYNAIRPHDSLNGMPPYQYAAVNDRRRKLMTWMRRSTCSFLFDSPKKKQPKKKARLPYPIVVHF